MRDIFSPPANFFTQLPIFPLKLEIYIHGRHFDIKKFFANLDFMRCFSIIFARYLFLWTSQHYSHTLYLHFEHLNKVFSLPFFHMLGWTLKIFKNWKFSKPSNFSWRSRIFHLFLKIPYFSTCFSDKTQFLLINSFNFWIKNTYKSILLIHFLILILNLYSKLFSSFLSSYYTTFFPPNFTLNLLNLESILRNYHDNSPLTKS